MCTGDNLSGRQQWLKRSFPSTAEEEKSFDMSLVVILLMAVGTVLVGSLW